MGLFEAERAASPGVFRGPVRATVSPGCAFALVPEAALDPDVPRGAVLDRSDPMCGHLPFGQGASSAAARAAGTAISRPPEVWASASTSRSSSASVPQSTCGSTNVVVRSGAPRDHARRGEGSNPVQQGHGLRVDARRRPRSLGARCAGARGARTRSRRWRPSTPTSTMAELARAFSVVMTSTAAGELLRRGLPPLHGGGDDPEAQGLGQEQDVPRPHGGVANHPLGVDEPGDGQAVLRLGVVDRMPTHHGRAAFGHHVPRPPRGPGPAARAGGPGPARRRG